MVFRISRQLVVGAIALVGWLAGCTPMQPVNPNGANAGRSPALIAADKPAPSPEWTAEVDFGALRDAYGARVDYDERCEDRDLKKRAAEALNGEDYAEAVNLIEPALKRCPVSAQLHLWKAGALMELGRDDEAKVHKRWFLGLIQSVLDSGDGKTAETAFITISIPEEYLVLRFLGLEAETQALTGSPYRVDQFTARDEEGNRVTIYFNPAWHFARLAAMFPEIEEPSGSGDKAP